MADDIAPGELLDRIQQLSDDVDGLSDVRARTLAQELVATVIAMYGDGLSRIMAVIGDSRVAGATILDQLAQDGAVASLLLIHDLYPVSLRERVLEALDTVRPYMESHGGNVELTDLTDGVATLVLRGSCHGCAASRATLELAIKQALDEHAPDLAGLEVQGVADEPQPDGGTPLPTSGAGAGAGITLPMVHSAPGMDGPEARDANLQRIGAAMAQPRWIALQDSVRPAPGRLRELEIDGRVVLFATVGDALLAYSSECASCGTPLGSGELEGGMLRCVSCDVAFDLRRAGRAAGGEPLQLRPVPLLESGGLRVAV